MTLLNFRSTDKPRALGDQRRDAGDWTGAMEAYSRYLDSHKADFAIWVQLGNCAKEAGQFAEAEKAYTTAVALNGRDADVWLQLGHLHKLRDRRIDALKAYEAAASIAPDHRDARHEIAALVGTRNHAGGSAVAPLGISARSLDALAAGLRKDAARSDVFRRYYTGFVQ